MATDSVSAQLKSGLAVHHLFAAQFFAQHATRLEESTTAPSERQRSEHRAYVLGTVFAATAFMEAGINELYISAADGSPYSEFGLDEQSASAMAEAWRTSPRQWPLLEKYRTALQRCGRADYDVNSPPFKEAQDLVVLRNAITHYKPEWDNALRRHAGIEDRLREMFQESRFSNPVQAFFPHRCLGAGCAVWAVAVSSAFVIDFRSRMGLKETFTIDQALIRPGGQTVGQ